MIHLSPSRASAASPALPDHAARRVVRAMRVLRAGEPIVITDEMPLVVLAAETATEAGLASFREVAVGTPILVAAAPRVAALLQLDSFPDAIGAVALPPAAVTQATLRALADPTLPQLDWVPTLVEPPALGEAAIELTKIGHLLPAALVAPVGEGGALPQVAAAWVMAQRAVAGATLTRVAEATVPLSLAPDARLIAFRPADGGEDHIAMLVGRPEHTEAPLVRLHSECFTGDVLGSLRCDCGPQLHQAIRRMAAEGAGILLYMAQEGRGIGLANKLRAYALQDRGLDTLDANRALGWGADERSFVPAAAMLKALGTTRIRLLTNNPEKLAGLAAQGIEIVARVSHAIAANGVNDAYLATKARRFGHMLE